MLQPILRYMPHEYKFDIVGARFTWYAVTALLVLASFGSIAFYSFNFGIDFAGGVLMEVRAPQVIDLGHLRGEINGLNVGEVQINNVGADGGDVMIRVPKQPGGDEAQNVALKKVQAVVGADGYEIRRTDVVGPKVGGELMIKGALAIALAIIAIAVYVWFRFEWQFALGTCLALCHDVLTTLGVFSIFQKYLEFDLTTVAAVLTIAGYSVNDSVVVYDRVREMLRKYKKMPLPDLLNASVNKVLPRTLLTVFTVLLTAIALLLLGGSNLRGFSVAMLWGLFVGTFSSIRVGMPVLLYFDLRSEESGVPSEPAATKAASKAA